MPNADAISLGDAALAVSEGATPRALTIFLVPVDEASADEAPRAGGGNILGAFKGAAPFDAAPPPARAGPADLLDATEEGSLGLGAGVVEVLVAVIRALALDVLAAAVVLAGALDEGIAVANLVAAARAPALPVP